MARRPGTERAATGGRTAPGRRPRGSLSEQQILDGAQTLVERDGLQQLSMPALARHLHSGVTSIYWYFRSKDELISALTDRVTHQMDRELPPIGDGPWDATLVEYFVAFRQILAGTPIYREVFAYRARLLFLQAAMAPSMLGRLEEGMALLTRAGLQPQEAAAAFNACSNYTRGFVLLEHGQGTDDEVDVGTLRRQRLDPATYPALSQIAGIDVLLLLDESEFRTGLEFLVAGIARRYGI
jgi:AcrR family transcriptional regulator